MIDNLTKITEDYILEKRTSNKINQTHFKKRLEILGKNENQIHEILVEIDDDCDKELLAGQGIKKAKTGLFISLFIALGFASLSIATALGYLLGGRIQVFFFGIIGASLVYTIKSYQEIKAVKHRKKRRAMKWDSFL